MKKYYKFITEMPGGYQHFEYLNELFSVDFWLKQAHREEREGCFVEMNFEYDSDFKKIVLTKFQSYNQKTKTREIITLIKNKEQILKLNKK